MKKISFPILIVPIMNGRNKKGKIFVFPRISFSVKVFFRNLTSRFLLLLRRLQVGFQRLNKRLPFS